MFIFQIFWFYELKCFKMTLQVVNGHGGPDPVLFRQTKEGELYFTDDNDMNLCGMACSSFVPPNQGQVTVKGEGINYYKMLQN